jgi:hypothetical protein
MHPRFTISASLSPATKSKSLDRDFSDARLQLCSIPAQPTTHRLTPSESVDVDWEEIWHSFIQDPSQDQAAVDAPCALYNSRRDSNTQITAKSSSSNAQFRNIPITTDTFVTTSFDVVSDNIDVNPSLLDDPDVKERLSDILREFEELIKRGSCSDGEPKPSRPGSTEDSTSSTLPLSHLASPLPVISNSSVLRRSLRASLSLSSTAQRRVRRRKSSCNTTAGVFKARKRKSQTHYHGGSLSVAPVPAPSALTASVSPRMPHPPVMPIAPAISSAVARHPPPLTHHYPLTSTPFAAYSPFMTPPLPLYNNAYMTSATPPANRPFTSTRVRNSRKKFVPPRPASCIVLKDSKGKKIFKCSDKGCGKECKSRGDLNRHLISSLHQLPSFPCHACGRVFQREDPLKRHWVDHPECVAVMSGHDDIRGSSTSVGGRHAHFDGTSNMDTHSIPTPFGTYMPMTFDLSMVGLRSSHSRP